MILRKFPLNFSVFFHVAIHKNISGEGKRRTSLQNAINRLLNPEPAGSRNTMDTLNIDNGKYHQIMTGVNPVPSNNLAAIIQCDQFKMAKNIISIWLRDMEQCVQCIASLLDADLLVLGSNQDNIELLEYLRENHIADSLRPEFWFEPILNYLESEGKKAEVIKDKFSKTIDSEYDYIQHKSNRYFMYGQNDYIDCAPFRLLKVVVAFCKNVSIEDNCSRIVIKNIIDILKNRMYPVFCVAEAVRGALDATSGAHEKSKANKFFDDLYNNDNEILAKDEQVLCTLGSLAEFISGHDSVDMEEKDVTEKNHIVEKIIVNTNAAINLAYILKKIAVFCSDKACTPSDNKTNFKEEDGNSYILDKYKKMASMSPQGQLRNYIMNVRTMQLERGLEYFSLLLVALKSYNSNVPIYIMRIDDGLPKLAKSYGVSKLETADSCKNVIFCLLKDCVFITEGKHVVPESLQMLGDKKSIELELQIVAKALRD